jgi:hypothetical protein
MFKDRIFIHQLSEQPSSLETTMFHNQNLEISGDILLLNCIKREKKQESRVIQEMAKRPELLWETDGVIYRNSKIYSMYRATKNSKISSYTITITPPMSDTLEVTTC